VDDLTRRDVLALAALGVAASAPGISFAAGPSGQLTWGIHVSLAPSWFDPAETQALITPFMVLYALHDAMVKPMPGTSQAPCLAESWSSSEDGLAYEFVQRGGAKFHNGAPVTAEDVKFSFERYRGASHALMQDQIAAIEIPDPEHVRFRLKKPWPDFLTFYSSASGAGWIVPKKYVEQDFKKAPIGAGPYKFVSFDPGVELVLEAFEGYWRKTPSVKRLVMKVIPDEATRLAALKRGEIDIAYSIRAELAEELRRTPGLSLKPVVAQAPNWIYFPDQWDPKSPWHDLRVRQAANLALDRDGINEALFLGYCKITNSIIPDSFDFYWQPHPPSTILPRQRICSGRPAIPMVSMPVSFTATAPTPIWGKQRSTACSRSGSAPSSSRSSGPASLRATPEKSSLTEFFAGRAGLSAMRRPGSPRLSSKAALTSMAAIPISTSCIRSKLTSSTRQNAPQSSKKCNNSFMRRRSLGLFGSLPLSTGSGPGSVSRHSD
jgi:Bacterial extracellular solute-binding proteins, family 5 Middle